MIAAVAALLTAIAALLREIRAWRRRRWEQRRLCHRRLRPVRSSELMVVFQNQGKPTASRREVSMQRVIQSLAAAI